MSKKKPFNPMEQNSTTAKQHDAITTKRQPVNKIKSTFYLNEDIKESLKRLAALNPDGKDLSSLVNESIYDLILKYNDVFKKYGIPHPQNPTED